MNGKFIVLEGIDGSGKTTQAGLLIKHLKTIGKKVKTIHFPRHHQAVFGNLVDEYLDNAFGPAIKLDYRLASVLYACDRFEAKEKINAWLNVGYWVVLDRYAESNFGHQACKVKHKKKRLDILFWLYDLDYKIFKNPRPDKVFFLDVPEKMAFELQRKTGKKKDGHEKNIEYLKNARRAYREACKTFKYWKRIECFTNGKLLSKEKITDKIIKNLK
ncbi:dTMP kinase [Candidatus Kuenenbacteria bacterium CG11_big_fil_rev_8_21_14_0_20_37_9]|nr:MAG: dTMP kinase [Candidatus Kuenenbacteria bacterium CG11_big_fil_rev_8_21_14_0_20_37_9]